MINFSALSDGYRNVIKIVTDIATKMCILNPYLGKETLKRTPGIVVIDELDLSLHPTWQRRIVGILKDLFPKVQFICATHSPFIIQSLEPGELTTLDTILDEAYSGQSIEDIAEACKDETFTESIYSISTLPVRYDGIFDFPTAVNDMILSIFGLAKHLDIDLLWHIEQKMKYNELCEKMHGKKY